LKVYFVNSLGERLCIFDKIVNRIMRALFKLDLEMNLEILIFFKKYYFNKTTLVLRFLLIGRCCHNSINRSILFLIEWFFFSKNAILMVCYVFLGLEKCYY
jgi:hypothetical protein